VRNDATFERWDCFLDLVHLAEELSEHLFRCLLLSLLRLTPKVLNWVRARHRRKRLLRREGRQNLAVVHVYDKLVVSLLQHRDFGLQHLVLLELRAKQKRHVRNLSG
jgi:hypothetical protein